MNTCIWGGGWREGWGGGQREALPGFSGPNWEEEEVGPGRAEEKLKKDEPEEGLCGRCN